MSGDLPVDADLKEKIRAQAIALGFDAVGFAPATAFVGGPQADDLTAYIADDRHGEMDWMARNTDRRQDPNGLWADVRTVISLGLSYAPKDDPLHLLNHPERGNIAIYARGRDYHDLVKSRLKRLARWLIEEAGGDVKVFVDTAPVMEKPLAAAAGLGWQGRHTNMVSREFGSWLFLGEVFTSLEIEPDQPHTDHCGSCRTCIQVCPTGALSPDGKMDARACISYLTIEHKGHIDRQYRKAMGNHIYGCDDCLAVCPWNKFADAHKEPAFLPRIELTAPQLRDFVTLDDAAFRQVFSGSPIKRTGRDRFVRNVLIAIGNSNMPELATKAEDLLHDPAPVVRGAAIWALSQLKSAQEFADLAEKHTAQEEDADVRAEWENVSGLTET
ncbi:MAG: tRNA epoxyqueuosine(34) reductase QueG [Alphaproteobacteria bacterium]|jgi:epoxyqueuosine reductase|nr:tRNA epoxyqueuosine(34) reductase QueG [Alphaproteobacteria bacterium]MBT4018072.1 tRNA epoxyqueuosine(34) reductase QueG [Alphaproteobacteria bacterium]MBT5159057.1 tRNA epoxyqueuosine(34) reductase QueG [Alphaproteobacteria bacterium]MBT5916964.1 tRNA epoxyqueuosine(34) reductase QueG [Alphaproteobacteria bacterium]MBT6385015.1 tRNA epoxyqueuosine(34) reductase QueG [Alphaproteobacteria bacterium]